MFFYTDIPIWRATQYPSVYSCQSRHANPVPTMTPPPLYALTMFFKLKVFEATLTKAWSRDSNILMTVALSSYSKERKIFCQLIDVPLDVMEWVIQDNQEN